MADHLGFYLSDTARLMRKRFDMSARTIGVTNTQWRVLIVIYRNPGINQGQLADRLEVEPITTCRMVDRMEQAGLLERRRDPGDRRAWQIFLTDAAQPLIDSLQSISQGMLAQAMAGFSQEETATLTNLLDRLRNNLLVDPSPQLKGAHNG